MSRQFTEQEAQRVFARMAEMQRADASRVPGALSLEDLREAAHAAGLDPSYVARAVAELDAAPAQTRTLAGAPVEVSRQRVVPGPLTDDGWAAMVEAARAHFGQPGMAGQIGRLREWTLISGGTKNGITTRLSAEPTEAGTRLILTQDVRETVKGFTIASVLSGVMALGIGIAALFEANPEAWTGAIVVLAMALVFTGLAQGWSRWWARDRADGFDSLLDRLELVARSSRPEDVGTPGAEASLAEAAPAAPRLDLDALGDAPGAEAPGARRQRERS